MDVLGSLSFDNFIQGFIRHWAWTKLDQNIIHLKTKMPQLSKILGFISNNNSTQESMVRCGIWCWAVLSVAKLCRYNTCLNEFLKICRVNIEHKPQSEFDSNSMLRLWSVSALASIWKRWIHFHHTSEIRYEYLCLYCKRSRSMYDVVRSNTFPIQQWKKLPNRIKKSLLHGQLP